MSHKTVVIPLDIEEKLKDLSESEREIELAKYGHKPLSPEDIAQIQIDEIEHNERMAQFKKTEYQRARKNEYDMIGLGNQLDAIWSALSTVKGLPQDALDIIEKIATIKKTYPKTEGKS